MKIISLINEIAAASEIIAAGLTALAAIVARALEKKKIKNNLKNTGRLPDTTIDEIV